MLQSHRGGFSVLADLEGCSNQEDHALHTKLAMVVVAPASVFKKDDRFNVAGCTPRL